MTSSGIKRGLAATAISALAVAGLPLLAGSASAQPMADNFASNGLALYTTAPFGVRNDGVDQKVHLLASAGSGVSQVRFTFSNATTGASDVVIDTVSRANGVFSTYWTPPTNTYGTVLPTVVKAQGLDSAGGEVGPAVDTESGTVDANATTVDIGLAPGTAVGLFNAVYTGHSGLWGVGSGTTSDLTNPVVLDDRPAAGDSGDPDPASVYGDATGGVRTWKVAADFTGYNWGTSTDTDEAVLNAKVGSDDNEAITVYQQTISANSTATAANPTVPNSNNSSPVTVKVVDQNSAPIAGAEVEQDTDGNGTADHTEYTDVNGEAHFTQAGASGGNTDTYTINSDDDAGYQSGKDFQRSVTVTSYDDAATTITANAPDLGSALDFDEYGTHPATVTVKDNQGTPKNNQVVNYTWTETDSFSTAADDADQACGVGTVTTGTNGTANIPAPTCSDSGDYTLTTYVERDGNPGATAGDLTSTLAMKLGQGAVQWADDQVAQAQAGTTATFEGKLALEDGTALPGREVTFQYTPGTEQDILSTPANEAGPGDSIVAATQPAGTTRVNNNSAKDTSDASGNVQIALTDPAETPQPSELGAILDAADAAIGLTTGTNPDLTVDWLRDPAVSTTTSNSGQFDLGSDETPGYPVQVYVNLNNSDSDDLTDVPVTFDTDHGFFTTHDEDPSMASAGIDGDDEVNRLSEVKPDPAPAEGANYGEWEDLGDSFNTTSDDSGYAFANLTIERDPGFDDDGHVTSNVTITAGGKTFTVPVTWDSSDPLNPGTLTITLADDQESTILPEARTYTGSFGSGQDVYWDIKATDQFGNRTDEPVTLDDGSSPAEIDDTTPDANYEGQAATYTYSGVATDQTLHATWDADTTVWTDADPVTAGFQSEYTLFGTDSIDSSGTKTLTADSETINWYDLDIANSVFTLTHTPSGTLPVGTTVQEVYKAVDQKGQPIDGLDVQFFRSGPDSTHTGGKEADVETNGAGEAYYIFQGETPGTATVTALAYIDQPSGDEIIQGSQRSDTVKFGGKVDINVTLKGHNNGGKKDKLKASGPSKAAGAVVKLQKRVHGHWKSVGTKTANSKGDAKFKVADTNGNKFTKYRVKYSATSQTAPANSNSKRVR